MSENASATTAISLLDSVRAGSQQGWERLARLYQPTVWAHCRRRGFSPHESEEITQDALLRIFKGFHRFERQPPKWTFRKWLYRVVETAVIDFARRRQRLPGIGHPEGAFGDNLQYLPDPWSDTMDSSIDSSGEASQTQLIRRALELLKAEFSPRDWQIFWEIVVDEMPGPMVAEKFGISPDNARQVKRRVLKRLEQDLAGLLD